MAARDNAYSRLVFWLKILLPLAALAILSTMFMIAHTIDPSRAIPFAKMDVTRIALDSSLGRPHYTGVTRDGSSLSVTAAEAVPEPDKPGQADATDVTGRLVERGGGSATLRSDKGHVDSAANLMTFTGNVHVDTSQDYHVTAPHMEAALDDSRVVATGGVVTSSPVGRITSDRLQLTSDPKAPGAYVLVFNGSVKLVYMPRG